MQPDWLALGGSAWCPEPESNRHGPLSPKDFKSFVSTNFTIRGRTVSVATTAGLDNLRMGSETTAAGTMSIERWR